MYANDFIKINEIQWHIIYDIYIIYIYNINDVYGYILNIVCIIYIHILDIS